MIDACWRDFQDQAIEDLAQNADYLFPLARLDLFLGQVVTNLRDHAISRGHAAIDDPVDTADVLLAALNVDLCALNLGSGRVISLIVNV